MGIPNWLKRRRPVGLDEDDFKEEIRAHLAIAANEKVADGADKSEAHYAALREFGNVTRTTEAVRGVWTPRWLEALRDLTSDLRYAVRSLGRNKAFALTVIGVLTLGIGLNAAVFTMLKGIALAPLSGVEGSSRLEVVLRETTARRPLRLSYPDYQYLRDHDRAFTGLFGSVVSPVGLGRGKSTRSLWAEIVTGNGFQVLGVRAQLGRTLLPSDDVVPGGPSGGRHQRRSVAARLRRGPGDRRSDGGNQQYTPDDRRRHRAGVSRDDLGLRRRGVHPGDDGAAARLHVRQPKDDGGRDSRGSARGSVLPGGIPAAGHNPRRRRRAG